MKACLFKECSYRTSRSSGPGGQHVNKTETRVELRWDMKNSSCLTPGEKNRLEHRLSSRLSEDGLLILTSNRFRSQLRNREDVNERFLALLEAGLKVSPRRIPTKPNRSSREKRIQRKKARGELKQQRKRPSF
jgi:ribosome-associated protein